jgi:hypothetical protein
MGGGLMQLVAYGAQDIYLTGNPQITFFKVVYRRHTNFAMESIEQTFNGAAKMGQKFSCTIARNGDLLSQVYLEMDVKFNQENDIEKVYLVDSADYVNGSASDITSASSAYAELSEGTGANTFEIDNTTGNYTGAGGNTYTYNSRIRLRGNAGDDTYVMTEEASEYFLDPTQHIFHENSFFKLNQQNDAYRIGQRAIEYVEVEIGGQCIDKHYGDWMDIWTGLTYSREKYQKWNRMVNGTLNSNTSGNRKLYIPLQFWFCKNPGLALPLIALQYHEVKINVAFKNSVSFSNNDQISGNSSNFVGNNDGKYMFLSNISTTAANPRGLVTDNSTDSLFTTVDTTGAALDADLGYSAAIPYFVYIKADITFTLEISNCCVFCDYIFLDTDERRRFAQVSHEYLIEQVQYSNALTLAAGDNQHELRFNHPVKEIVWAAQTGTNAGKNFNYFNGTGDMIKTALLQLNGHDRMKKREGSYFRCVQPYQHHTGADGQSNTDEWGGYYCYSFGLKPEEHQPSGTCNFSRIDNAVLIINGAPGTLKVWAINYNVLRIMSGMGGLAYSN